MPFGLSKMRLLDGVCYRVNQTFRLRGTSKEAPWDLYQLLANNQPADFGGFIDFGHDQVLSRSPGTVSGETWAAFTIRAHERNGQTRSESDH